jgi:hypothetical protein
LTVHKVLLPMASMAGTCIDDKEGIVILITKFSPDNMNIPHIVNWIDIKLNKTLHWQFLLPLFLFSMCETFYQKNLEGNSIIVLGESTNILMTPPPPIWKALFYASYLWTLLRLLWTNLFFNYYIGQLSCSSSMPNRWTLFRLVISFSILIKKSLVD